MKHVGIFEAKTNLSRLIEQVEKGQEVTITRHGKPRTTPAYCAPSPTRENGAQ